jgi:NADH-quinone oxidoreductase subunit H
MVDPVVARVDRLLRDWRVIAAAVAVLLLAPAPLVLLAWPWIKPLLNSQFTFSLIVMGAILFIVIHLCAGLILAERKVSAFIQDRKGPNRVGFWGLLQPVADGLKFLLKEDVVPGSVDKPIFVLAPALAFVIALVTFAVIPWAGVITWPWPDEAGNPITVHTQVASLDIGVLYMLALGAMSVYGVVLAGWASNNKYAFYGGMRATAQMLSYEIPLGLGILTILLVASTLRLEHIVDAQAASGVWNVFLHPLAFLLVFIAGLAETNRAPFDLAECEQELIAGYHTEYSAMKFALFFLAEYAHMTINSALLVVLFLGGWHFWFLPGPEDTSWMAALIKFGVFWAKIMAVLGMYMLIRWTLPRFRFDQLMRLAWKGMIPLGMAVVAGTGVLVAFGWQRSVPASLALNVIILAGALWLSTSRKPVTGRQENMPDVEVVSRAGL